MRIHEVAVDWTDDLDSRVDIIATALADLRGMARVGLAARGRGTLSQLGRFAMVGVLSTAAYVLLYAALRGQLTAPVANAIALVVTAVGNTAANRRLTFGVRGSSGRLRHHLGGLVAFTTALGVTSAAVTVLGALNAGAGRALELAVLVGANLAATTLRFVILRRFLHSTA